MKKYNFVTVLWFVTLIMTASTSVYSLSSAGAWERQVLQGETQTTEVLLIAGNYFSWTAYMTSSGEFISTKGGVWNAALNPVIFTYEFHTKDSTLVGSNESWSVNIQGNQMTMVSPKYKIIWTRSSSPEQTALSGAFLFAGRKGNDQNISRRDTNQPRKTLKLLAGGHFQWIAYNTDTKQFFGTGGGIYTAQERQYTETIRFFSRDVKRVGAVLHFEFSLLDSEWHHSGKSSNGEPLYEIWAPRS